MESTFSCSVCGSKFRELDSQFKTNQAWGCAGVISIENDKSAMSFGFGSKYDCNTYELKLPLPAGNICDKCADLLILDAKQTHCLGDEFNSNRENSTIYDFLCEMVDLDRAATIEFFRSILASEQFEDQLFDDWQVLDTEIKDEKAIDLAIKRNRLVTEMAVRKYWKVWPENIKYIMEEFLKFTDTHISPAIAEAIGG